MRIQTQGMVGNDKSFGQGHIVLALFNFCVVELFHFAAVEANHVVVVLAFVQFIDRFATFKMIPTEQTGLFKLCQHTVDRGQADVRIFKKKLLVNIFRCHVPLGALLKDLQNLLAGNGGFESGAFEFVHEIGWQMKERG